MVYRRCLYLHRLLCSQMMDLSCHDLNCNPSYNQHIISIENPAKSLAVGVGHLVSPFVHGAKFETRQ